MTKNLYLYRLVCTDDSDFKLFKRIIEVKETEKLLIGVNNKKQYKKTILDNAYMPLKPSPVYQYATLQESDDLAKEKLLAIFNEDKDRELKVAKRKAKKLETLLSSVNNDADKLSFATPVND